MNLEVLAELMGMYEDMKMAGALEFALKANCSTYQQRTDREERRSRAQPQTVSANLS